MNTIHPYFAPMPHRFTPSLCLVLTLLSGCEMLGIESPEKLAAVREADGKAIGSACRHAGRAIEDCYALNKKAEKASVFSGWRDMNDYMRENKIEPVTPQLTTQLAKAGARLDGIKEKMGTKGPEPH
jgi:hypothetical protein